MKLVQVTEENKRYYTKDFIHGFNTGAKTQYEADKKEAERRGRWVVKHGVLAGDGIYGDMGECSVCGLHLRNYEWDYCPNCGARMDEVEMNGEENGMIIIAGKSKLAGDGGLAVHLHDNVYIDTECAVGCDGYCEECQMGEVEDNDKTL